MLSSSDDLHEDPKVTGKPNTANLPLPGHIPLSEDSGSSDDGYVPVPHFLRHIPPSVDSGSLDDGYVAVPHALKRHIPQSVDSGSSDEDNTSTPHALKKHKSAVPSASVTEPGSSDDAFVQMRSDDEIAGVILINSSDEGESASSATIVIDSSDEGESVPVPPAPPLQAVELHIVGPREHEQPWHVDHPDSGIDYVTVAYEATHGNIPAKNLRTEIDRRDDFYGAKDAAWAAWHGDVKHRGRANTSGRPRVALFFVYANQSDKNTAIFEQNTTQLERARKKLELVLNDNTDANKEILSTVNSANLKTTTRRGNDRLVVLLPLAVCQEHMKTLINTAQGHIDSYMSAYNLVHNDMRAAAQHTPMPQTAPANPRDARKPKPAFTMPNFGPTARMSQAKEKPKPKPRKPKPQTAPATPQTALATPKEHYGWANPRHKEAFGPF